MNTNPVKKAFAAVTINYHETASNAITDLTGTKWTINSQPTLIENDYYEWNINFISNNQTFNLFYYDTMVNDITYYNNVVGDSRAVGVYDFNNSRWVEAYRTIEITGGTDATNADLISWLQANATQIQDEPSNTFSFGNLPIENVYFGTQQVKKIYMGNALVWEKEENLISFNVNGTDYQAQSGMTWAEWVNSPYNTGRFSVLDDAVQTNNYVVYNEDTQQAVSSSDIIDPNATYITFGGGSGQ